MDDLHHFAISGTTGRLVRYRRFRSEALLRRFIVRYAYHLFDITVLASEHIISTNGGGRIDAIGIDAAGHPVIVEFKRIASGSAICQGMYYLDWRDRHRDLFSLIVMEKLGPRFATRIDWSHSRFLCVAEEIGEREEAVARQIGRMIELLQIKRLPNGLVVIQ